MRDIPAEVGVQGLHLVALTTAVRGLTRDAEIGDSELTTLETVLLVRYKAYGMTAGHVGERAQGTWGQHPSVIASKTLPDLPQLPSVGKGLASSKERFI